VQFIFMPIRKVQPYLCQFSQTHKCPTALSANLIPNFTQNGQQIWKVQTENNFCPHVQHDFQCAEVHNTRIYLNHFLDISRTKCHPSLTKNVENRATGSLSTVWLSVHIFTHQTAQQHYVECFYTEVHPNWSKNIESMSRKPFNPLINEQLSLS
jgi:hypothetical protein